MERLWIAIYTSLILVSWSSSDKVELMQVPSVCSSCMWIWDRIPVIPSAWRHLSPPKNYYITCDLLSNSKPNNWLRSNIIPVREGKRLDVTVEYFIIACQQHYNFCNESFSAYVWESNTTSNIPDPTNSYSSYRRFATFNRQQNDSSIVTIPLEVNSKFIVLGFRDQGGCRRLYSVKVSYDVCVGKTLKDSLVSLPKTLPPLRDLQSIPVNGSCATDSDQAEQGSMTVLCESTGEWNTSLLEGRCVCKENRENIGGICSECSRATYNEGNGFNCTGLPSAPRDINAAFVNETAVTITWMPPFTTGLSHVSYDVHCLKPCEDSDNCGDTSCGDNLNYVPNKEGLHVTHVTVTNLFPFEKYTFEICSKNRVSKVAERIGVQGNFTTLTIKTLESVPGKLQVSLELLSGTTIQVSWKLDRKNGIIQAYYLTYTRVDDPKDTQTIKTPNTRVIVSGLKPGKTYKFVVMAENRAGSSKSTSSQMRTTPLKINGGSPSNNTTLIAVSVVLSVVLIAVLTLLGIYVYRQRKAQKRLEQRLGNLQAGQVNAAHEEDKIHMDVVLAETEVQYPVQQPAEYMDIGDFHSFELERDDIKFVKLLGSGNFGEVFKATMGNGTVAVKSLKDTATPKDKVDMIAELNVMKSLEPHPHVLKLIGCCSLAGPLLIVLEYLPYGDLLGYLRKSRGHPDSYNSGEKKPTSRLTARDLLSFAWMIADGMKYLSKMKIVHRDLAARNILVDENKVCKVSDFGLARDVNADIYVRTSQARLPVKWMPPESLFRGESSTMSDVWSYGIVLWEVFTIGDSPYPGVKAKKVASLLERGYRMSRPIHISEELFSIMSECWSEKPEDRPTFQWICAAVKRLINDQKNYVNLDVYNDEDYVNFDMFD